MNKYWKILDWIIGGIVTILYLYGPMWSCQYNCFFIYRISKIVTSVFLMYCLLSGIYWIKNKKTKIAFHYFLIVAIYISLSFTLFIVAASIG